MDRIEGRSNGTRDVTGKHVSDPCPASKSFLHILLGFLKLVTAEPFNAGEERPPLS